MTAIVQKSKPSFGPGTIVLAGLSVFGFALMIIRWVTGLGATTAMIDGRGWGIWIGFDVLCGIALAAGAFSVAATVYIFQLKEFYPILRPTVLTGFIGYGLAALSISIDLGFPHRIWHLLVYWNVHSPLFEVGWCVMTYLTVLGLEISPIVFEKYNLKAPLKLIRSITIPLVILGVVLSTMHQSSLGTLFLPMLSRVNPLWYSAIMPILFFISAVAAGLSMVIIEATLSSAGLNHRLEVGLLGKLAKAIPYVLGLYLALRVVDMLVAGDLRYMFTGDLYSLLFWAELILGVIVPIILFSLPATRKNRYRMFWTAILVVFGLIFNRINISLIGFDGAPYWPTWQELFISIGMVSIGALVFVLATRYLAVFSSHHPEKTE
ncbi:MAG: Ni/Fe-hydrogenase cytochrome b subunit [Anaerolineaceae bacterium]|nr:Ni/Fe-hydrogenase cytochrome b subunit [Anaerolineaceae bacterium]